MVRISPSPTPCFIRWHVVMKKLRSGACKTCPEGGESLNILNPVFHLREPRWSYSHVYKCEYKKRKEKKLRFYKLISMCTRACTGRVQTPSKREREKKGTPWKGGGREREKEESEGCAAGFEFARRRTFIIRTGRERGHRFELIRRRSFSPANKNKSLYQFNTAL